MPFSATGSPVGIEIHCIFKTSCPVTIAIILLQCCEYVHMLLFVLSGQSRKERVCSPGSECEPSVLGTKTCLAAGVEIKIHDAVCLAGRAKTDATGEMLR